MKHSRILPVLFMLLFFPVLTLATSDSAITARIKTALDKNELTHHQLISVETHHAVVTLKGKTDSVTQATKAIEIAASTDNVKNVDSSQLFVVNSVQPLSDTYITAKVKGVFLRNQLFHVSVETQNGVVYLSGTVKNAGVRTKLIGLAKSVDGVSNVKSSLEIKS